MPISINDFFQHAVQPDQDFKLHLEGNDTVAQGSGLTGIKKYFASAQKAENRAVAREFYKAVEQHFAENAHLTDITGILPALEKLIRTGKPLTAAAVHQAQLGLEFDKNFHAAEQLSQAGKIPKMHVPSLAMFAMARNLPLDGNAEAASAVKQYFMQELAPKEMNRLPAADKERAVPLQTLMKKAADAMKMDGSEFSQKLQDLGDNCTFEDICRVFEQEKAKIYDTFSNVPASVLKFAAQQPNSDAYIALFNEVKDLIPDEKVSCGLIPFIMDNNQPIAAAEERSLCINLFAAEMFAAKAAESVMEQKGLPKEFARAVAHNPSVMAEIKQQIAEESAKAKTVLKQENIDGIIQRAAEDFTQKNLTKLQEFKEMVQNPPLELEPPLTAETMPQYINMMLTGEKILEPILSKAPIDKNFLQNLADHVQSMNSAAYGVKGEFGADDLQRAVKNSIQLLLAKQGVTPSQYMEIMANIQIKFGALSREISALTSACQQYKFRQAGINFLSEGMTMFRALESHAKVMLSLMSHDQRVLMQIEKAVTPGKNAAKIEAQNEKLVMEFLENTFEAPCKMEEISLPLREFAQTYGITVPNPPQKNEAAQLSAETARLMRDNALISSAVVNSYVPEKGMMIEEKTDLFRNLFAKLAAKPENNFSGINVDRIDVTRFTQSINNEISLISDAAVQEGKLVESADVHAAVEKAVESELKALQELFARLDALPADSFTADEKAKIKDTIVSFNIRNFEAVTELALLGKKESFYSAVSELSTINPDGLVITPNVIQLAQDYHKLLYQAGSSVKGEADAIPFLLSFAAKMAGITQDGAKELLKNLTSAPAEAIADTCLYALNQHKNAVRAQLQDKPLTDEEQNALKDAASKQANSFFMVPAMMDFLRHEAEVISTGNSERSAVMFYEGKIQHFTQIPVSRNSGIDSLLNKRFFKGLLPNEYFSLSRKQNLTPQEYESLANLVTSLNANLKRNSTNEITYRTNGWLEIISDSVPEILAELRKNGFKPLNSKQLWNVLMGTKMPPNVTESNFHQRFFDLLNAKYRETALSSLSPEEKQFSTEQFLELGYMVGSGISIKKLFDLLNPKGKLTLEDIPKDMLLLGNLASVNADTAYRLKIDFPRMHPDSELNFIAANGEKFTVKPHPIDPKNNTPDNPEYLEILDKASGITHSEGQFKRVMQAFSQASLSILQPFSTMFSGIKLNEHGSFSITATEQQDGTVLMDILNDEKNLLHVHEQFLIRKDGSYECTKLEMMRRSAVSNK